MTARPLTPREKRILKISSGAYHFLALDEEGRVWSWTDGFKSGKGFGSGQLGHGDNKKQYRKPKMIDDGILSKLRVDDVECGLDTSYALTSEGLLFGWGSNWSNQVQPGNIQFIFQPFLMTENVLELFSLGSSSRHIFFRKLGEIGFCGENGNGQLGIGTRSNVTEIQTRDEIGGIKPSDIRIITSNEYASFILTTGGEVFSTGEVGYSGHSEEKLQFTKIMLPAEENVVDIVYGLHHTVFMMSQGHFYYFESYKRSKFPISINRQNAFGAIFFLPQLSVPELYEIH